MKRIYLKAYTATNLGDDLFVRTLCARYPHVRFYISCSRFHDTAFESIPNLTIMNRTHFKGMVIQNFKRMLNFLRIQTNFPFDAQVYIGGSIFIQPKDPDDFPEYEDCLYKDPLSRGLPYFIISANFGPYDQEGFAKLHQTYFSSRVRDICFRDQWSRNLFRQLPHVRYAPDALFTCPLPPAKHRDTIVISCIYNDSRAGLEAFHNDLYLEKMAEICNAYLHMGKRVCLLSMCAHQGDETACEKIQNQCNGFVESVFYRGNIDPVLELFARAEYVIAARFHAMILAWVAGVPVFPICYNNKARKAMESYHFTGAYASIQDVLTMDFSRVDANRVRPYIIDAKKLRQEAESQFSALDRFLARKEGT